VETHRYDGRTARLQRLQLFHHVGDGQRSEIDVAKPRVDDIQAHCHSGTSAV
jgi:hypothetical protein